MIMKKLLFLMSIMLVTSIGYSQTVPDGDDCKSPGTEDCKDEWRAPEDDGWKVDKVLAELTKRRSASAWSKISKCNMDAEKLILQISRLVRGSDKWIDQVDKMYLKYSSCLRKAQPKKTNTDGEKLDKDKATAI